MKKIALLSLLLFVATALISVVNTNDLLPVRVGDYMSWQAQSIAIDEGIVYTWTDNREGVKNLYVQLVSPTGQILWTENGILLDESDYHEANPRIIKSSDNNVFIVYESYNYSDYSSLKVLKINSAGEVLWINNLYSSRALNPEVMQVNLVADNNDGVFIAWINKSNGNLSVQHFNSHGIPNWENDGLIIDTAVDNMSSYKSYINLIISVDNELIISYKKGSIIKLSRVSLENNIVLEPATVLSLVNLGASFNVGLFMDYDNNLIFSVIPESAYSPDSEALIIKTDTNGNNIWNLSIISNSRLDKTLLLNDNSILFASHNKINEKLQINIKFTKIDSNGQIVWELQDNTFNVPETEFSLIDMFQTGDEFIVFSAIKHNFQHGTLAQKYNLNGEAQWEENGIIINELSELNILPKHVSISNYDSDFFISSVSHIEDKHIIKAQKINQNGNILFPESGIIVYQGLAGGITDYSHKIITTDDLSYIFWFDHRYLGRYSIFYQIIDNNNNLILHQNGKELFPSLEMSYNSSFHIEINPSGEVLVVVFNGLDGYLEPYAQIVNSNGDRLLGDSGLKLMENDNYNAIEHSIVLWQNNAWDIFWVNNDRSFSFSTIMTQRIQNNQLVWGNDAKEVYSSDALYIYNIKSNYLLLREGRSLKVFLLDSNSDINQNWNSSEVELAESYGQPYFKVNSNYLYLMIKDYTSGNFTINIFDHQANLITHIPDFYAGSDVEIFNVSLSETHLEILCEMQDKLYLQKYSFDGNHLYQQWGNNGLLINDSTVYMADLIKLYDRTLVFWSYLNDNDYYAVSTSLVNPDGSFAGVSDYILTPENKYFIRPKASKHNNEIVSFVFLNLTLEPPYGFCDIYTTKINTSLFTSENDQTLVNIIKPVSEIGNYPNPFNPETKISFNLKDAGNVSIEIFNIKGQKIKNLTNETFNKGQNTVSWDGTNDENNQVASGLYFYKISTSNYSSTHKMMLLK